MKILTSIYPTDDNPILLKHWLDYYRSSGILHFHVLYMPESSAAAPAAEFKGLLAAKDIEIVRLEEPVKDEAGRVRLFSKYKLERLSGERMVFAVDLDEFVSNPGELFDLACRNDYDFITGRLIDRFAIDATVPPVAADKPIWEQYPLCSYFSHEAMGALTTKIPLSKPKVEFTIGLHRAAGEDTLRSPAWEVHVSHFKWTGGIIEKLRNRLARNDGDEQFIGSKYRAECEYFLENHAVGNESINLTGIYTWYQPRI